jgi:hypothetical protein
MEPLGPLPPVAEHVPDLRAVAKEARSAEEHPLYRRGNATGVVAMKKTWRGAGFEGIIFPILLAATAQPASADTELWVKDDRAERRTCPNISCGLVGRLFFREKATILEERYGWGRISQYYDASCRNGISEYVDAGNAACSPGNGIVDGKFAEWVPMENLSTVRPPDPSAGATGDYSLVKGSDDYRLYKDVFARAAGDLIKQGKCTASHFREWGGWYKSPKSGPLYFTYCGDKKVLLNAETGTLIP